MSELEQKRGRGRPENNDNEVLTAILNNEDKRKEFVEAIENLVYHKRKIEADMLLHKEDVAAVSVRFGIAGFADDEGNVRIPIGASSQGLLGTGSVQVDFEQGFSASAISSSVWSQVLGIMTVGVTNNTVTLNSSNSLASAASARLVSYRQFKTPRGSDRIIAWRMMLPNLVTGAVTEIGAFAATGITAPTSGSFFRYGSDGTLRGVSISVTGAESTTEVIPTPSLNVAHDYVIWIMSKSIVFQIDDVVVGSIQLGGTAPSPVTSESSPFCARLYNASATSTAQQVYLHRCVGALYGGTYGYDRQFLAAYVEILGIKVL